MSRFGKTQEDQLRYMNSKFEKINEEMVNRINNELIPTIKQLSKDKEILLRIVIQALFKLGGSIQISEDALNDVKGTLLTKFDSDTKIVTFSVENKIVQVKDA